MTFNSQLRWGAVLFSGALAAAIAVPATAAKAPQPDLTQAVSAKVGAAKSKTAASTGVQVNVTRGAGTDTVFGTTVATVANGEDTHPEGWLFAARLVNGKWQVGLEGEQAFTDLTAASPVVSAKEKQLFGRSAFAPQAAGGDYRTGMRLPYAVGTSWSMPGGAHGWAGSDTPYSAIDLAGGNGQVLAARGGTAYTMCGNGKGWIRVIHDRGYATDYYHLHGNIAANGLSVSEGTFLGNIGTDVSCGGSASGAHVHFALRQNSAYVGIAGHNVGGWVFQNSSAYNGTALHGSTVRSPGQQLHNYGALGFTQGIIDSFGGGTVNKRTGPGTNYALAGSIADATTVNISCSKAGTSHTGRWGTSNLWNRLSDGTWVSDAFMWTGLSTPVNGTCP
ncbi:peptidoglycan DD-metalloendopeptidase family protein [Kribbella sandramycini]|uniref:LasA protease n=1 Tax=Kribbella sandramycini TaxID=60450 RepID=A0A7Y4KXC5_9ACTN|nr:M23 family metallopeptidase [Kribbella sandramycini]MBB6569814.1 LasA protease [Kribbella sandramycini]NOL40359.1 peptidoglycan DD-metalloendopeptidase family protein [Kribbella sandramycini]